MNTIFLRMRIWSFYPDVKNHNSQQPCRHKLSRKYHYHPLLNHVVLHNLLTYVETSELPNCRLVCKTWNIEATNRMKNQLQYQKINNEYEVTKFLKVSKNSVTFPHQCFYLTISNFSRAYLNLFSSITEQLMVHLKIVCRSNDFPILLKGLTALSNLKILVIYRVPEESLESVFVTRDSFISPISNSSYYKIKLANLKSLSFRSSNPRKPFLCNYTRFIVLFLKSIQNLNTLEFYYWSNPLMEILRDANILKLRSLIVEGRPLGHTELTLLTMRKFHQLTNLEIKVDKSVNKESLTNLIESFSETIKVFKIR